MTAAEKTAAQQVAEQVAAQAVCTVPGCKRQVLHRGLCPAHWEDPHGTKRSQK